MINDTSMPTSRVYVYAARSPTHARMDESSQQGLSTWLGTHAGAADCCTPAPGVPNRAALHSRPGGGRRPAARAASGPKGIDPGHGAGAPARTAHVVGASRAPRSEGWPRRRRPRRPLQGFLAAAAALAGATRKTRSLLSSERITTRLALRSEAS